jgi:proline iminopeptidase
VEKGALLKLTKTFTIYSFTIYYLTANTRLFLIVFEATTAQPLADKGFYVIVYDRRGEGRSLDSTATFTYREAITDLNEIYQT